MRKIRKPSCVLAVSLCSVFFALWLSSDVYASTPSHIRILDQPKIAATPVPDAEWHMAAGNLASEWDVYLTGSDISGIALDGNTIWAASNGGLLHWDRGTGSVMQYLTPRFPLPSNSLSQVLFYEEKLYISGYGGVAIFDREDNWTLYTNEDIGLELSFFVPMAFVDDVLWIGAEDGIGQLFPDGHWEIVRAGKDTFPNNSIDKIVPCDDGVYVVVALGPTVHAERQVVRFAGGVWEIVDRPLMIYTEAPDGSLWKSVDGNLSKSEDQGVTWDEVLEGYIRPRTFDTQGRLYATDDDTIYMIDDERVVETFRFTDVGPELNYINIIEWDAAGRLWIATDGRGLTMFDGERWYNWQDGMSGMRDDCIRGMAIGGDKLYARTHGSAGTGGVNVLDIETRQWSNFWPEESELSGGGVDGIAIDSQGQVYFPTSAGVLDIYDGETWNHIPMPLPQGYILSTSEGLFDQDGNYWVGTSGSGLGLWKYDGSEWTIYDIQVSVNALALDQEGRLWVGTSEELIVRNPDGSWLIYTADQLPLVGSWIQDLAIDSEGRIWMISYNSLLVFNGQEYQEILPAIVGASGWGDAVAFDPQGNTWVEAGMGLAMFRGEPGIKKFSSLTLPPAHTVSEEDLVINFDELVQRYQIPTMPMVSPQLPNWVFFAGITIVSLLCLLVTVIFGVVVYLVLRRKKAEPSAFRED